MILLGFGGSVNFAGGAELTDQSFIAISKQNDATLSQSSSLDPQLSITIPTGGLTAYDLLVVDNLFYGPLGKANSASLLAFEATIVHSSAFKETSEALDYFNSQKTYYQKIADTPGYTEIARGGIKSGIDFFLAGGKVLTSDGMAGTLDLIKSSVSLAGLYLDFEHRQDIQSLPDSIPPYAKLYDYVQLQVGWDVSGVARPILKQILTNNSNTSDDDYINAVRALPASKGDLLDQHPNLSDSSATALSEIHTKVDALIDNYEKLAKSGHATEAQLKEISAQIEAYSQQLGDMAKAIDNIQDNVRELVKLENDKSNNSETAAREQLLRHEIESGAGILRNVGILTNNHSLEIASNVLLNLAVAYLDPDPIGQAYAVSNILVSLFGGKGEDPNQQILEAIQQLGRHIDERLDRVDRELEAINESIVELQEHIDNQFRGVHEHLENAVKRLLQEDEIIRRDIGDLRRVVEANYQLSTGMEMAELVAAAEAFDEVNFTYQFASTNEKKNRRTEWTLERSDLLKAWKSFLVNLRPDSVGLGHPILAGPNDCIPKVIQRLSAVDGPIQIVPVSTATTELRKQAQQFVSDMVSHTFSGQAYCVAEIAATIAGAIPRTAASEKWIKGLRELPLHFDSGGFSGDGSLAVYSPYALEQFLERSGQIVESVTDIPTRLLMLDELSRTIEPAIKQINLFNSEAGDELLLIAYYGLVRLIQSDVKDIFFNDFMKSVSDFDHSMERFEKTNAIPLQECHQPRRGCDEYPLDGVVWVGKGANLFKYFSKNPLPNDTAPFDVDIPNDPSGDNGFRLNMIERESILTWHRREHLGLGLFPPKENCFDEEIKSTVEWDRDLRCYATYMKRDMRAELCSYEDDCRKYPKDPNRSTCRKYPRTSCVEDLTEIGKVEERIFNCLRNYPSDPNKWKDHAWGCREPEWDRSRFEVNNYGEYADDGDHIKSFAEFFETYKGKLENEMDQYLRVKKPEQFGQGLSASLQTFRMRLLSLFTLDELLRTRLQTGSKVVAKSGKDVAVLASLADLTALEPFAAAAFLDAGKPGSIFDPHLQTLRMVNWGTSQWRLETDYPSETGSKPPEQVQVSIQNGISLTYSDDKYVGLVADGWRWAAKLGSDRYHVPGEVAGKVPCEDGAPISFSAGSNSGGGMAGKVLWSCSLYGKLPQALGLLLQSGVEMEAANHAGLAATMRFQTLLNEQAVLAGAKDHELALTNKVKLPEKFNQLLTSEIAQWHH